MHLLAADHAQHTTKPLARQTLRVLHSASHAATSLLDSAFSLSPYFCSCCESCRLQAKVDSIPITPRLPQTPAASFKRLYRKRAGAPCCRYPLRRKRASDRALAFLGTWHKICPASTGQLRQGDAGEWGHPLNSETTKSPVAIPAAAGTEKHPNRKSFESSLLIGYSLPRLDAPKNRLCKATYLGHGCIENKRGSVCNRDAM